MVRRARAEAESLTEVAVIVDEKAAMNKANGDALQKVSDTAERRGRTAARLLVADLDHAALDELESLISRRDRRSAKRGS
jgi:hypothetical protein